MRVFDQKRFDAGWGRYVAAGVHVHAQFRTYLASGASENEIADAEAAVGCAFPADLRHLQSLHNGSSDYMVLPGWELFSAQRLVDEWRIWQELYHDQFKPDGLACDPDRGIRRDEWWRLRWIPFCGDGGGNHLCVDMDPAEDGVAGQVITMWHDDARRELIAASLTEFVEQIAGDFEQGDLWWDEDFGGVYEKP